MELANQINFIVFGLVAFALLVGALSQFRFKQSLTPSIYWPLAIGFLAIRSLSFGLAPLVHPFLLTIANTSLIISTLALVFLFHIWRDKPFSKTQSIAIWCIPLVLAAIYEPLRTTPDTFQQRVMLIVGSQVLLMFWQLVELKKTAQQDASKVLRWLMLLVVFEIFSSSMRIYQIVLGDGPKNIFIYTEGGWAFALRWFAYIVETLELILVSVYYLEKRILNENRTNLALSHSQQENAQISKLLAEKEQLLSELIRANKTASTGALAASIAHELNQPLGASLLNLDFLKMKLATNTLEQEMGLEILSQLQADNMRASGIIKSLRSIFLSADTVLTKQNLIPLLDSVLVIVGPELKKHHITLTLNAPKELVLPLNDAEMRQVIVNLLNNAIEALTATSGQDKHVHLTITSDENSVVMDFSDNGPGVSPDHRQNLFELLRSNGKETGMGLGLWLCKHIIARHNGKISYQTSRLGGASFLVELPAR